MAGLYRSSEAKPIPKKTSSRSIARRSACPRAAFIFCSTNRRTSCPRPAIMEYVKERVKERVYPVGRLDFASEGLIILTNDGEFTKLMTQAGVIPKVYHVKLSGQPGPRELDRLRRGLYLDNERLAPCSI